MKYNNEEKTYHVQPNEQAWRRRLGLLSDKPAKSGECRSRIMSDKEAERYGVSLSVVRSARARKGAETRKARKTLDADLAAQAETVERLAETGERVTA